MFSIEFILFKNVVYFLMFLIFGYEYIYPYRAFLYPNNQ